MNDEFNRIIESSRYIVLFTGAGISCGSGIPDFRSSDGLYKQKTNVKYSPEQIISHTFLMMHPDMFFDFYKSKMLYPNALPNSAHFYFADLEKQGKLKAVITQNIDGLHQKAGSKNVLELHGSVHRNYCEKCFKRFSLEYVSNSIGIPKCDNCGGVVRPDVVLYEESLNMDVIERAITEIERADCLIVVGTSLTVQPAAGMVNYYKGNKLVLVNKQKTPYDKYADLVINDDIEKVIL